MAALDADGGLSDSAVLGFAHARCSADMPRHDSPDASALDAIDIGMADTVRLARIAHILSAFGSLMYDMLLSRTHLAAVVGAFAAGLVTYVMADMGIEQWVGGV